MARKCGLFLLSAFIAFGLCNGGNFEDKNDQFDWALFNKIAEANKNENVVISPISVKILLKLLEVAAIGHTKQEISQALADVIQPGKSNTSWYQEALKSLQKSSKNYKLNIGTKFFLDERLNSPTPEFLKVAKESFDTSIGRLNFRNVEEATDVINNWVADITAGNIKDLVTKADVADSVAVLVNALYFKGQWEERFSKNNTRDRKFTLSSGETIETPSMARKGIYLYSETNELGEGTQLLRMSFKGGKYAITFILPKEGQNLDNILASIKPGQLSQLQEEFKRAEVDVQLPKFEFLTRTDLNNILQQLNIRGIFSGSAELPGLGKGLQINKALQEAGVKLNEDGMEMFAATVIKFWRSAASRPNLKKKFIVDRPFAFCLEDEDTGALLFIGKVTNPLKEI